MKPLPILCSGAAGGPILARLAGTLPAFEVVGNGKTLPADIQWMPPGKHKITAHQGDSPVTLEVIVNAKTAETMQRVLSEFLAKAVAGTEDAPYLDFNHNDAEASAHPTEFFWGGDDAKTGGVRVKVDWTEPGAAAVKGKAYRRFSPSFFPNANGEVIGAPVNMGGLVNRAAFKQMQPLLSKEADAKTETKANMDPLKDIPTDLSSALAIIAALRAKCADAETDKAQAVQAKETIIVGLKQKVETFETAAKTQKESDAKAVVAKAVQEGKIAPQDTAQQKHYEDLMLAAPVQAKAIIEALPVNPAFQTVIDAKDGNGNGGPTPRSTGEHAFLVKAKAHAQNHKVDLDDAMAEIARVDAALYTDYCNQCVK